MLRFLKHYCVLITVLLPCISTLGIVDTGWRQPPFPRDLLKTVFPVSYISATPVVNWKRCIKANLRLFYYNTSSSLSSGTFSRSQNINRRTILKFIFYRIFAFFRLTTRPINLIRQCGNEVTYLVNLTNCYRCGLGLRFCYRKSFLSFTSYIFIHISPAYIFILNQMLRSLGEIISFHFLRVAPD